LSVLVQELAAFLKKGPVSQPEGAIKVPEVRASDFVKYAKRIIHSSLLSAVSQWDDCARLAESS
jgi:hypothetical protein